MYIYRNVEFFWILNVNNSCKLGLRPPVSPFSLFPSALFILFLTFPYGASYDFFCFLFFVFHLEKYLFLYFRIQFCIFAVELLFCVTVFYYVLLCFAFLLCAMHCTGGMHLSAFSDADIVWLLVLLYVVLWKL